MLDYEILRIIWWVLVVVLLIGFAVTDGFDMGVTALLPVAGKKEVERRIMINSIAPMPKSGIPHEQAATPPPDR